MAFLWSIIDSCGQRNHEHGPESYTYVSDTLIYFTNKISVHQWDHCCYNINHNKQNNIKHNSAVLIYVIEVKHQ